MKLYYGLVAVIDLRLFIDDVLLQPEIYVHRFIINPENNNPDIYNSHELLYAMIRGRNINTKPKEMA